MTLAARIKLIDDMIRENPDATIKDYLELVKEFKKIRVATNRESRATVIKPITINGHFNERYKELK